MALSLGNPIGIKRVERQGLKSSKVFAGQQNAAALLDLQQSGLFSGTQAVVDVL